MIADDLSFIHSFDNLVEAGYVIQLALCACVLEALVFLASFLTPSVARWRWRWQWRRRWRRRRPETIRPDIGMLMIIWWREERKRTSEREESAREGRKRERAEIAVEFAPGDLRFGLLRPRPKRWRRLIDANRSCGSLCRFPSPDPFLFHAKKHSYFEHLSGYCCSGYMHIVCYLILAEVLS